MAEERVVNRCKSFVKDSNGNKTRCDTILPYGKPECVNKKQHMWRSKSGYCEVGWCEGTAAKDSAGKYVKTCPHWMFCNCDCHEKLDRMFSMTDTPRIEVDNPKYIRPKSSFWMPDRTMEGVTVSEDGEEVRQATTLLEVNTSRHFNDTNTGKRARGQLEYEVLNVCKNFVKGVLEVEVLTPGFIALEIDEVEPPSVGAIGAVFDRWVKLGFAVCEKSPVRFTSFTADGIQYGLDNLKAKARADKKRAVNAAGRTLRPRLP